MNAILTLGAGDMTLEAEQSYVDLSGFTDLYFREYPRLYAVATAMAGELVADDLVQDTMVKVLVNWQRVERLDRPGGWCHRVLVNFCTSWYRRRRTESRYLARQRRVEASTAGPSADSLAFCQALQLLPARPRAVVALHYIGDRTLVEVASILGIPEGTVRSDVSRARAVLAAELGL